MNPPDNNIDNMIISNNNISVYQFSFKWNAKYDCFECKSSVKQTGQLARHVDRRRIQTAIRQIEKRKKMSDRRSREEKVLFPRRAIEGENISYVKRYRLLKTQ